MNEASIKEAIESGSRIDSFASVGQIETAVLYEINCTLKLRGQGNMDAGTQETTVRKLAEVLLRDYPDITDKELRLVMEAGVSGELGRETWVSGASIMQWLRNYYRHVSRLAVIGANEEQAKGKTRKTKAEIEELNNAACKEKARSAFEYYKQHGTIFGDEKIPEDLKEDERAAYFADEARSFHLPQFAAIVWEWIKAQGGVAEPSEERMLEANRFADEKVASANTRKEYVPAAHDDWRDSYLLEQYYKDLLTN